MPSAPYIRSLALLSALTALTAFTACTAPVAADSRGSLGPDAARPEARPDAARPEATRPDTRRPVGAYGTERDLSADDRAVFAQAVRNTAAAGMTPYAVSSQIVAGRNYRFRCRAPLDSTPNAPEATYIVTVFRPLAYTKLPPRVTAIDCVGY